MSLTLTQRTKALVVGAVLAAATTLAVLPGTAEAAKKTGGDVVGNAGGSSGISAPAPIDSGATLDSDSGTTQDATISDQPQVSGATDSTTEVIAPAAPADGAATVDGNVAAGDTLNEDVCLNGALNQDAGGCGDAAAAPAPGSDAGTTLDGSIDTTTSLGENADGTLGFVDAPDASLTDGGATLDSTSGTTQDAAIFEQPQLDGTTDSTTEAAFPAAPVQGTFGVDETVAVGDTVNEDVCVQGGFNAPAGSCDAPAGTAPVNADVSVLDGTLDSNLGDTTAAVDGTLDAGLDTAPAAVDSTSGTTQDAAISGQPQASGATNSTTEANVSALPVEGTFGVDDTVAVGDFVEEDVCVQGGVNAPAGGCGETAGGGNAGTIPAQAPAANGRIDGTVGVDAPVVPAQGGTGVDGDIAVDETAALGVCLQAGVNQDPSTCDKPTGGDGTLPPPALDPAQTTLDSASSVTQGATLDGQPRLEGTVNSITEANVPGAPVEGTAGLDQNVAVGDTVNEDVCVQLGVNAPAGSCGAPAGGGGGGNGTPTLPVLTPVVADVDGTVGVDTPVVPVRSGTGVDGDIAVDDLADLGICLNVGVNQDPGTCGNGGPGNGGPGNGGPGNSGPGDGGPGNGGPGDGGPGNGGPGDSGPGDGGPGNGGPGDGGPGNSGPGNGGPSNGNNDGNGNNGGSDGTAPNLVVGDGALPNISGTTPNADTAFASVSTSDPSGESDGAGGAGTPPSGDIALVSTQPLAQQEQEAASSDASSPGEQSSAGEEGASSADSSAGGEQEEASGNSVAAGRSLPETGGISPLLPIAALLLMGAALVLVARRRIDS